MESSPKSGQKNLSLVQLFTEGTHKLLQIGKVAEDFFTTIDEVNGTEEPNNNSDRSGYLIEVTPLSLMRLHLFSY